MLRLGIFLLAILIGLCTIAVAGPACNAIGGQCIPQVQGSRCNGYIVISKNTLKPKSAKTYCDEGEVCCAPSNGCPETLGWFYFQPSGQCFKLFHDIARNFDETEAKCAAEGSGGNTVIAHPFDALGLRSYMVQQFGELINDYSWYWLNAKRIPNGSGGYTQDYSWLDNGAKLLPSIPLWWPGRPVPNPSSQLCLVLTQKASDWELNPDNPYGESNCDSLRSTLCEWKSAPLA